ncbi:Erg28-like protein [Eremomyces bilateralis CBS 781.70]|uniref:Erg28-like protein n=1 Tax=Eremomyces bilateralis CBS 781.70 TaxID=1392243 RepID=A0A6G1G2B7_9PEZI|nr:Erg28-like protein [Eremomyces bilateralis CBS 781.70]KAF1812070.1 Erg28-like protein [Eremomyces bilateralis CBS 781.70]
MDAITAYLPQHAGFLPKWLFFTGIISIGNSIQAYSTLEFTKRVYNGAPTADGKDTDKKLSAASPVTPLAAHLFATWTFTSAMVRLIAAYHITTPPIFWLAFVTYTIAFSHFGAEWLIYGNTKLGAGLAGPLVVSTSTIAWMLLTWQEYLG